MCCVVFFQAEDGIRDLVRSRGLGDVYKRQVEDRDFAVAGQAFPEAPEEMARPFFLGRGADRPLSLIHI